MNHPPNAGAAPGPYPPPLPPRTAPSYTGLRIGLGLGLLAIPVVATLIAYVLPTLRTLQMSFEEGSVITGNVDPAGTANYEWLFSDLEFFEGLAALAVPILGTVLTGAVVAPLVAWCLHSAGAATRMVARIVWGVLAVAFAPAAMVVAWLLRRPVDQRFEDVTLLDWTPLLSGVLLGAGVLVGLAAFRGGTDTGKRAATVLTASGLFAIAVTAAGLQTFTFTFVIGLPRPPETPPMVQIFRTGFQIFDVGHAAAMSITMLGILALLGIGAALLFILTRTRIDVGPGEDEPRSVRAGFAVGGIVLLVVLAAGTIVGLWPWLSSQTGSLESEFDPTAVMLNTWVPALTTTLVALTAALAGGFAVGALRPLGDGTRWLLLLFAPWLFVGTGPLAMVSWEALSQSELIGTYASLAPRAWIAVPALFVFTALFWGLEDRRRSKVEQGVPLGRANSAFAASAAPMAALVGMFVWIANAQDTIWQVTVSTPDYPTAAFDLLNNSMAPQPFGSEPGVGVGYPIALMILFAAAMAAAAVFYLPRVGVRIGRRT